MPRAGRNLEMGSGGNLAKITAGPGNDAVIARKLDEGAHARRRRPGDKKGTRSRAARRRTPSPAAARPTSSTRARGTTPSAATAAASSFPGPARRRQRRPRGGDGNDFIDGNGGSDSSTACAGDDQLRGVGFSPVDSDGDDTLKGGPGTDSAFGGNDTIDGEARRRHRRRGCFRFRRADADGKLSGGRALRAKPGDTLTNTTGTLRDPFPCPPSATREPDTIRYDDRTTAVTVTANDNAANDGVAGEKDNVRDTVENILGGSAARQPHGQRRRQRAPRQRGGGRPVGPRRRRRAFRRRRQRHDHRRDGNHERAAWRARATRILTDLRPGWLRLGQDGLPTRSPPPCRWRR